MRLASGIIYLCLPYVACGGDDRAHAEALVESYALANGLPPAFVAAIVDVESAWRPLALSEKGAAGLMQLMVPTAYRFGVANRFHIEENVRGGMQFLAVLAREFGDLRLVAAAYYAGEARIRRAGLRCADPDIRRYVAEVERRYRKRLRGTG